MPPPPSSTLTSPPLWVNFITIESFSITDLKLDTYCHCLKWMLQLYVNMKEYTLVILLHEQALTLIAMHYTKDTWHWRSKVTEVALPFLPPHHCSPTTRDFMLVGLLLCRGHLCIVFFTSSSVSSTNVSSELTLLYGQFLCHSLPQVLLQSHLQFCPMHTSLLLPRWQQKLSQNTSKKIYIFKLVAEKPSIYQKPPGKLLKYSL